MPKYGRTIIIDSNLDELMELIRTLQELGFSRIEEFTSYDLAWDHLVNDDFKSSIKVMFIKVTTLQNINEMVGKIMSHHDLSHIYIVAITETHSPEISKLFQQGVIGILKSPLSANAVIEMTLKLPSTYKRTS